MNQKSQSDVWRISPAVREAVIRVVGTTITFTVLSSVLFGLLFLLIALA